MKDKDLEVPKTCPVKQGSQGICWNKSVSASAAWEMQISQSESEFGLKAEVQEANETTHIP